MFHTCVFRNSCPFHVSSSAFRRTQVSVEVARVMRAAITCQRLNLSVNRFLMFKVRLYQEKRTGYTSFASFYVFHFFCSVIALIYSQRITQCWYRLLSKLPLLGVLNRLNFLSLLLPASDDLRLTHCNTFVLCAVKPTEVYLLVTDGNKQKIALRILLYFIWDRKSHSDLNNNEIGAEKLKKFAKFWLTHFVWCDQIYVDILLLQYHCRNCNARKFFESYFCGWVSMRLVIGSRQNGK